MSQVTDYNCNFQFEVALEILPRDMTGAVIITQLWTMEIFRYIEA